MAAVTIRVASDAGRRVIRVENYVDGSATNASSVLLSDSGGSWGIRRLDTGATVVADGTAFTSKGGGAYEYTFTPPAFGVNYEVGIEVTQAAGGGGQTHHETVVLEIPNIRGFDEPYIDEEDLTDEMIPYLSELANVRNGQVDFEKQRIKSREWLDRIILTKSDAYETFDLNLGLISSKETVRDWLERGQLKVTQAVKQACVWYALHLVCLANISQAGDKYDVLSERFLEYAKKEAHHMTAEFDTDRDGEVNHRVRMQSVRAVRG